MLRKVGISQSTNYVRRVIWLNNAMLKNRKVDGIVTMINRTYR